MDNALRFDHAQLLERDDSCLVIIDVQPVFLNRLPLDWRGPLVERIAWLMRVARVLCIPIVATAEDMARNGPLVPELTELLPADSPSVFNKMVFGLYGQQDTREAIEASRRGTFILVGCETDVCVAQSAIGIRAAGYRVCVVENACGSPPPNHEVGIQRMRDAGIIVTSLKGVYFEWVRDLKTHHRVMEELNAPLPAGVTL